MVDAVLIQVRKGKRVCLGFPEEKARQVRYAPFILLSIESSPHSSKKTMHFKEKKTKAEICNVLHPLFLRTTKREEWSFPLFTLTLSSLTLFTKHIPSQARRWWETVETLFLRGGSLSRLRGNSAGPFIPLALHLAGSYPLASSRLACITKAWQLQNMFSTVREILYKHGKEFISRV